MKIETFVLLICLSVSMVYCGPERKREIVPVPVDLTSYPMVLREVDIPRPVTLAPPLQALIVTPTPLLPEASVLESILALYETNGNCELPCWWGVAPGRTHASQVIEQLGPLGHIYITEMSKNSSLYEFTSRVPVDLEPLGWMGARIFVENDLVIAVATNSRWVKRLFDHSLPGLLQTFGEPDEIWIKPGIVPYPGLSHLEMILFYPYQGIMVRISGEASDREGYLRICPQDVDRDAEASPVLYLWSTRENFTFERLGTSPMREFFYLNSDSFRQLGQLRDGKDNEWFFNTYLDPGTVDCIDIDTTTYP